MNDYDWMVTICVVMLIILTTLSVLISFGVIT